MRYLPSYLTNVLSKAEADEMTTRLRVAELLQKGLTYRQIIAQTGVGAATVARIAKRLPQAKLRSHSSGPAAIPICNRYSFGAAKG